MDMELAKMIIEAMEKHDFNAELKSNFSGGNLHNTGTHGVEIEVEIGVAMAAIITNADIFVDENGNPIFAEHIGCIRSVPTKNRIMLY